MNLNPNYKRLPLESVSNARDIGGYPVIGGGITKWHTFLRSEGLESVTDNDAAFLFEYGIRTVIDLRIQSEFMKNDTGYLINTFAANNIVHNNIPFLDSFDEITGHYYIYMIENGKKNIRQIFEYIGERINYGGILYNCFAGKDRTGILSAFLLLICGVSELDVLADYMVSSVYLKRLAEKCGLSDEMLSSKPEYMEEFLGYLNDKYKSVEQYLLSINVSSEIIATIRKKFIQL